MATTQKTRKAGAHKRLMPSAAETSAAKLATKPATRSSAPPTTDKQAPKPPESTQEDKTAALSREVGTALLNLAKQTPEAESAAAITRWAQTLSMGGPVHNKALGELRDAVDALAATLRAANKAALARQFSVTNRSVRRLERASRRAS